MWQIQYAYVVCQQLNDRLKRMRNITQHLLQEQQIFNYQISRHAKTDIYCKVVSL